jgi:hypothetical protein
MPSAPTPVTSELTNKIGCFMQHAVNGGVETQESMDNANTFAFTRFTDMIMVVSIIQSFNCVELTINSSPILSLSVVFAGF